MNTRSPCACAMPNSWRNSSRNTALRSRSAGSNQGWSAKMRQVIEGDGVVAQRCHARGQRREIGADRRPLRGAPCTFRSQVRERDLGPVDPPLVESAEEWSDGIDQREFHESAQAPRGWGRPKVYRASRRCHPWRASPSGAGLHEYDMWLRNTAGPAAACRCNDKANGDNAAGTRIPAGYPGLRQWRAAGFHRPRPAQGAVLSRAAQLVRSRHPMPVLVPTLRGAQLHAQCARRPASARGQRSAARGADQRCRPARRDRRQGAGAAAREGIAQGARPAGAAGRLHRGRARGRDTGVERFQPARRTGHPPRAPARPAGGACRARLPARHHAARPGRRQLRLLGHSPGRQRCGAVAGGPRRSMPCWTRTSHASSPAERCAT